MNKIKTNEIKNKLDDTKRWEEKIKRKYFKYQTNIYIYYIYYIYINTYIYIFFNNVRLTLVKGWKYYKWGWEGSKQYTRKYGRI